MERTNERSPFSREGGWGGPIPSEAWYGRQVVPGSGAGGAPAIAVAARALPSPSGAAAGGAARDSEDLYSDERLSPPPGAVAPAGAHVVPGSEKGDEGPRWTGARVLPKGAATLQPPQRPDVVRRRPESAAPVRHTGTPRPSFGGHVVPGSGSDGTMSRGAPLPPPPGGSGCGSRSR